MRKPEVEEDYEELQEVVASLCAKFIAKIPDPQERELYARMAGRMIAGFMPKEYSPRTKD